MAISLSWPSTPTRSFTAARPSHSQSAGPVHCHGNFVGRCLWSKARICLPNVLGSENRRCSGLMERRFLTALPSKVARGAFRLSGKDGAAKGSRENDNLGEFVSSRNAIDPYYYFSKGSYDRPSGFTGEDLEEISTCSESLPRIGAFVVDDVTAGEENKGKKKTCASSLCPCELCGRRVLLASLGGVIGARNVQKAASSNLESSDYNMIREAFHPARSAWYEEFYAQSMARTMVSYEAELADYKRQLFRSLDDRVEQVLELGIGTGPNLKYYGSRPGIKRVVGVDPNLQMAKYCTKAASDAGLSTVAFEFVHAVGEGIPAGDESMDAVVCTLVLCSVTDVSRTLEEVKRVLRPGGIFLFVEHVPAPDGTGLRFWQGLLDPLQQWVADGCHLTRNTLQYIEDAQFGSVQTNVFTVASVSLIGPHILGIAHK